MSTISKSRKATAPAATTAASSYAEYLSATPQDKLQSELSYLVQEKKSHWEISLAKTRASLDRAKHDLNKARSLADLDAIITLREKVDGYTRGLAVLQEEFDVLFPA